MNFRSHTETFNDSGSIGIRHLYSNDNNTVRFAVYHYDDDDENIYFSNLYVDPSLRKTGIATKILNWFFEYIRRNTATHYKNVILNVKKDSWVRQWYERLGFEYLETCGGEYEGNVWMIKRL